MHKEGSLSHQQISSAIRAKCLESRYYGASGTSIHRGSLLHHGFGVRIVEDNNANE